MIRQNECSHSDGLDDFALSVSALSLGKTADGLCGDYTAVGVGGENHIISLLDNTLNRRTRNFDVVVLVSCSGALLAVIMHVDGDGRDLAYNKDRLYRLEEL